MKQLLFLLLLYSNFSLAQECPHYAIVFNVYRKDRNAIDEYAKQFIKSNPDLFYVKQRNSSYIGRHGFFVDSTTNAPYAIADSGVIANCIWIYKTDTMKVLIGFLSKNNRTKVNILHATNYNSTLKEFLWHRFNLVYEEYHKYLKTKKDDLKHW